MAKTILIVEDNALVLKVYNTALASVGANLLEARDGDEAMRLAAEYRPDLVIMDIMLPGVSELDLTRRIKDDLPDTKVIAVTTLAMATDQQRIKDAGADAYLPKPINVDSFVDTVKDMLE
jgi:two-component system, cell cycle response regulator DivK